MSGRLLSTLFALACLASPAQAGSELAATRETSPLDAWIGFCQTLPEECAVDTNEPETIVLTRESRELIEAVNRYVNAMMMPVSDVQQWGKPDQWDMPAERRGDCEDYQILKRHLLVEAGLPRRAIRMTVVLDQARQGHAVLTVRTDAGDLILDNLTDDVLPWNETGYVFLKRESAQKVGWVALERAPGQPLTVAAAQ